MDSKEKDDNPPPSKDDDDMSMVDLWLQTGDPHQREAQQQPSTHPWQSYREFGSPNEPIPHFTAFSALRMVPGNPSQAQHDPPLLVNQGGSAQLGTQPQPQPQQLGQEGISALADPWRPHHKTPARPSQHSWSRPYDYMYFENPAYPFSEEPGSSQAGIQKLARTKPHSSHAELASHFAGSYGFAHEFGNTTQQRLARPNTPPSSGNAFPGIQMAASIGSIPPNDRRHRVAPFVPSPPPPSNSNLDGNPALHYPLFSSADIGLAGPSGSHSFHGNGAAVMALAAHPSSSDDAADEDATCTPEDEARYMAYIREVQSLSHNSSEELRCKLCSSRTFSRRYDLILHIRSMHLHQRNFQCNSCSAKFKRKAHLESHIKAVHERSARYQCVYCFKIYTSDSTRRKHCRQVHKTDIYDLLP